MKITLAAARVNAGYTVKEASRFIGVTPSALSNYESGIRELKVNRLLVLLNKYNVKFEDITFKTREDYLAKRKKVKVWQGGSGN